MKNIIVPTDFSDVAINATDYAIELARQFDAKITLVHAYSIPVVDHDMGFSGTFIPEVREYVEEQLAVLKKSISDRWPQLKVYTYSHIGDPKEVIETVAEGIKADAIVMGITGEAGKFKEHFIGSTAIKIARHINIPALIIPGHVKYRLIHKISFACDLRKTEETDLAQMAKYFSQLFDAELEIIHVQDPKSEITVEKSKTSYLVEKRLKNVDHQTIHMLSDHVADSLCDFFEDKPTDMILVSPKHHNLFYYLFNKSVTKELAFHSNVPVLAIH